MNKIKIYNDFGDWVAESEEDVDQSILDLLEALGYVIKHVDEQGDEHANWYDKLSKDFCKEKAFQQEATQARLEVWAKTTKT